MTLSIILFITGMLGFILNRRHLRLMLISIELMLLSVTLLILVTSYNYSDMLGQRYSILIISVAAAESAIGLGITIAYYRLRGSIALERLYLCIQLLFLYLYLHLPLLGYTAVN